MILSNGLPPQRRPQVYPLDPAAKETLGNLSPQLAWLQVTNSVITAMDDQYPAAERLRLEYDYPVDLPNLVEVLMSVNPVRGINHLVESSPDLSFNPLPPPLQVLEAA